MIATSPDKKSSGEEQVDTALLDGFSRLLQSYDFHLSLSTQQPVDWRILGVEVQYGRQHRFRLSLVEEEIRQMFISSKLTDLTESMINEKLVELKRQRVEVVENRARSQNARFL
jgi:hypothetical protein